MKLVVVAALLVTVFVTRDVEACTTRCPATSSVVARATRNGLASSNPRVVAATALAHARSNRPQDVAMLGKLLLDSARMERLTRPTTAFTCEVRHIINALADNPTPEARALFYALLDSPDWEPPTGDDDSLVPSLRHADYAGRPGAATARIRPVSPRIVAQWLPQLRYIGNILAENGTPEAVALLQLTLVGRPRFASKPEYVAIFPLSRHRDNPALLAMALKSKPEGKLATGITKTMAELDKLP